MFKSINKIAGNKAITFIALMLYTLSNSVFANTIPLSQEQVDKLIKNADNYRLDNASAKIVSKVTLYKNNLQDKTRSYSVYTRENRESLVVFDSPIEAGQKMLMLGDNYWLLMPKSRRPIRITPMQKLLGEASIGDISTLTWSEDYQGEWLKEEQLTVTNSSGIQALVTTQQLLLKAKTKGASYFTIKLWLDKKSGFPIKADLYLQSGKLAKQALFIKGKRDQQDKVVSMRLDDSIQKNQHTVIDYKSITPMQIDDKYYNPAYLSRSKNISL